MKTFPFTKVFGAIAAGSGALAVYADSNNLKTLSLWAGGAFAASSALGTFLSRNHSTTDEQAVGVEKADAARASEINKA